MTGKDYTARFLEMGRAALAGRVADPACGAGTIPDKNMVVPFDITPNIPPQTVAGKPSRPSCEPADHVLPVAVAAVRPVPVPVVRLSSSTSSSVALTDAGTVVSGLRLSAGALRVFRVLHGVACDVARARAYSVAPDFVAFHLPQGLVALAAGYTTRHVRRLLAELVAAGLLDWGAHASKVNGMSLWDGCLWSVRMKPGADSLPHLRRDEWRHEWRDFAGDIDAGRTVKAVIKSMSELHPENRDEAVQDALTHWAVNPGNIKTPLLCSSDMDAENGPGRVQDVREVVYRLGELPGVHASKRAGLIGRLASALAAALDDRHSRRWYCAVIWEAFRAEGEGRGGLQVLMAALLRLDADRREWEGLRSPGALLASRLRAA